MSDKIEMEGNSLLKLEDLEAHQIRGLVEAARELKAERWKRKNSRYWGLTGQHIAMLFEKASTRTRCAASVAASNEGGHVSYLGTDDIHLGKKESVRDTARVLGRMFDGLLFRGYEQSVVEQLADHAGIPVWNGLTDECHPTQALADLQTILENFRDKSRPKVVYLGDGGNNVCRSLMMACAVYGFEMVNCCPEPLAPSSALMDQVKQIADPHGAEVSLCHTPPEAVRGANVLYTDVWASMGEEDQFEERLRLLKPYQVNMSLVEETGNLGTEDLIFLHCLPAFHNHETAMTKETGALEVTDEVFEAPFSRVFDQAENRIYTLQAIMRETLNKTDAK